MKYTKWLKEWIEINWMFRIENEWKSTELSVKNGKINEVIMIDSWKITDLELWLMFF